MSLPNDVLQRLLDDIPTHAATCMYILDKVGTKQLFQYNRAQWHIHAMLEEQLARIGKVRALILKGRQQGCSTYVAQRFYQKTSTRHGKTAFIVAHEQKATDNLFNMVKRYHDYNPIAPATGATNAKELKFNRLDSGYKLATAGSQDVGRSNTAQYLHGSEFAFWDNPELHFAGLGNTVSDNPGTEIILESTANGIGNKFHKLWQDAEAGRGEYIAIFVPWFWQDEYRAKVPDNFELSKDDRKYQVAYGLDDQQMAWRQNKIILYGKGYEWLFDQEYPATPALAFKSSTQNPLITPTTVSAAVNSNYAERYGPLIIGCDPADEGDDRTAVAFRQGRTCFRIDYFNQLSTMEVAGLLADMYREMRPDGLLVDKIGIGAGIVDRLRELNIPVIGVNSAESAHDKERYGNKRAEMWYTMKEWLEDQPNRLPDDEALKSDLSAPQGGKYTSNGARLLESKKDMKKRGVRSPDGGDALALTFAEPIAAKSVRETSGSQTQLPASKAGY